MSHAIRNSLILAIVLLLFAAACWGYINYYQIPEKKQLKEQVDNKKQELKNDQEIANRYPALQESYDQASTYFNNYEKTLYRSSNEDNVYDFLNTLNSGLSFTDFNFAFTDSVTHPKYGIINMEISGKGSYRNLVNFIRGIEQSKPLNKVQNLNISPDSESDKNNTVSFTFSLKSFYDRSKILEKPSYDIFEGQYASLHNPFLPLVRDVEPNDKGRIEVNNSKIIAMGPRRVFLVDQNGVMKRLAVGDDVYLGELSGIDLPNKQAIFTLNKGGIVTQDTLMIQNEN